MPFTRAGVNFKINSHIASFSLLDASQKGDQDKNRGELYLEAKDMIAGDLVVLYP